MRNGTEIYLARVKEAQIENRASYSFWGIDSNATPPVATWVTDIQDATTIFTDSVNMIGNGASVAYNAVLNRYLAVYACGAETATDNERICARWTTTTGAGPGALTSGWSAPQTIYSANPVTDGVIFATYQAFQHAQFASANKIYISSAKNNARGYDVTMREFTVSP